MVLFWKAAFLMLLLFFTPVFAHVQPSVAVGPPGSLPHFFVYHSEDHPGGAIPNSSAPLREWVPDLAAFPTRIATSGRWSQIWGGSLPGADDVVLVPENVTVVYDVPVGQGFKTLGVKGAFVFDPLQSVQLRVGSIMVYDEGTLVIRPANRNSVHEVVIDGVVNPAEDPAQFGVGITTIGGVVDIQGATVRSPFVKFVRASAGENTITLAQAALDWQVGDEIFIAGYTVGHFWNASYDLFTLPAEIRGERFRITGISGTVITLNASLQYTHTERKEVFHIYGSPFLLFNKTFPREPGMVAHLTRNVVIRSAQPSVLMRRGHIAFTGTTNATMRGAYIEGMGRTTNELLVDVIRFRNGSAFVGPVYVNASRASNFECGVAIANWSLGDASVFGPSGQLVSYRSICTLQAGEYIMLFYHNGTGLNQRGRYALHAHHLHEAFDFSLNVIFNPDMDLRWGIVSHNSYGNITRNVVIWKGGGGIVSEYGTETGPVFGNLVIGMGGGDGDDDNRRFDGVRNQFSVYDYSQGGFGYWFASRFNEITNNVADGLFRVVGFDYYGTWYGRGNNQPVTKPDTVPDFLPLASDSPPDLYGGKANLFKTPNRLFSGNVNYAYSETGHSLFTEWDGSFGSILYNYTSYYGGGFASGGGEDREIIIDGNYLVGSGRRNVAAVSRNERTEANYVMNSVIENFDTGIEGDGRIIWVENVTFRNVVVPFVWYFYDFRSIFSEPVGPVLRNVRILKASGSNEAPTLTLTAPFLDSVFNTESTVTIMADASDVDGTIVRVEFFSNQSFVNTTRLGLSRSSGYNITPEGARIGEDTDGSDGWSFSWARPPPGRYKISARATDNNGGTATFAEIPIEVLPGAVTTPVFYRGIDFGNNLNLTINGNRFEYQKAPNYVLMTPPNPPGQCDTPTAQNGGLCPQIGVKYRAPLYPPADPNVTELVQTGFTYRGDQANFLLQGIRFTQVPTGVYQAYLYAYTPYGWPSTYSVVVNNRTLEIAHVMGPAGSWYRLGPYTATATDGNITLTLFYSAREGMVPYLSGAELWRLEAQGQPINQPPRVSAAVTSIDRSNPLVVTASLQGTVVDDGLPSNTLKYYWKVYRVPDGVHFSDPLSPTTTVRLFRTGVYQFQLVANDGLHETESNVVTVEVPSLLTGTSSTKNAQLAGATFYRGINLGGPALAHEGNVWDSYSASDLQRPLLNYSNQSMPLYPRVSGTLADMLRDGTAGTGTISGAFNITNIPPGVYQVSWYVVTPPYPYDCVRGDQSMNGQLVSYDYPPSAWGSWTKFGPYTIEINDGRFSFSTYGSYCGSQFPVAGVELWRVPASIQRTNVAPSVDAGFAQTIVLPMTASLLGKVDDDGASVSTSWSFVSGPGSVNFGSTGNLATSASFSATGTYLLRLTASDGTYSAADEVAVLVRTAGQIIQRLLSLDADGTRMLSGQLQFVDRSSGMVVASINFSTNSTGQQQFDVPSGISNVDVRIVVPGYLRTVVRAPDVTSETLTPLPTPTLLAGDFNSDSAVNSLDWSTMNRNWFGAHVFADINRDGVVNSLDFSFLSKNWLRRGE